MPVIHIVELSRIRAYRDAASLEPEIDDRFDSSPIEIGPLDRWRGAVVRPVYLVRVLINADGHRSNVDRVKDALCARPIQIAPPDTSSFRVSVVVRFAPVQVRTSRINGESTNCHRADLVNLFYVCSVPASTKN